MGSDYLAFMQSLEKDIPTSIRFNPYKNAAIIGEKTAVPWEKEGFYLAERPIFAKDPLFHAGAYYVQEASSMLLGVAFSQIKKSIDKPLKILDLCAAPGGKSTHMLSLIKEDDLLISNEMVPKRADILLYNLQKWGRSNVFLSRHAPEKFLPLKGYFDVVLVDAPCSGEGMFRKDAQAINDWSPEHVRSCALRQKQIIDVAATLVAEGGYLVYSTCTYNAEENENQLAHIAQNYDYQSIKLNILPKWNISTTETDNLYAYAAMPHLVQGEGFFIGVLQQKTAVNNIDNKQAKNRRHNNIMLNSAEKKLLSEWFEAIEAYAYVRFKETIKQIPMQFWEDYLLFEEMQIPLKIITDLGVIKGKSFVPAAAAALRSDLGILANRIELEDEQAEMFLRKETHFITANNFANGWYTVSYKKNNVGWIKILSERINNYYPNEWRLIQRNFRDSNL